MELDQLAAGETPAVLAVVAGAFLKDVDEEEAALDAQVIEPERTLVAREDGRIVACAAVLSRELTVPGGTLAIAGVSLVGVAPTHRRRGLLSAMMRRQLADVRERLAPVHETVRKRRPGMLARPQPWWELRLRDPEHEREGAGRLRAAVLGELGYVLYAYKEQWGADGPDGELRVRELIAVTPAAAAALWGFVLELDLVRRASWLLAPADEPLPHMVDNARAVSARIGDGIWVRLVDLPRALRERAYSAPFEVVLEVTDETCPWNAGRHRLGWDGRRAACEPTRDEPDLVLSAAELGAAYLGGTTLASLARAGRVRERTAGALEAASVAFRGAIEPWCPEIF
jgi:predicted acetyltransferase